MRRKRKTMDDTPAGYPYMLYRARKRGKIHYGIGVSEKQAIENMGITIAKRDTIDPVWVFKEVASSGHQKTHELFEKFGTTWITKKGNVYFPPKQLK